MQTLEKILFFIFFFNTFFLNQSYFFSLQNPRIWNRLPKFFVKERVYQFMNENRLTNCYEYRETPSMLLLKCWTDERLKNVKIEIEDNKKRQQYYTEVVTV